jgi:PQQ-dependent catabolism-associated CXXCW motif protein
LLRFVTAPIAAGVVATAAALAAPPPAPALAPGDQEQYQRFLHADTHRAFAVGPTGQYGWSAERDDTFSAVLGAVYNCNKAGKALCAAYAVDDTPTFRAYDANVAASNAALQRLRDVSLNATYAGEANDYGIAPEPTIHRWNLPGETPASVPGARLILTRYVLAQLVGPAPPVLIDVSNSWGSHSTLPGAIWMRGAGDDAGDKNAAVSGLFTALLATVAPDHNTPVVVFCEGRQFWGAYNAALRAVAAGYVNVYWYRGGIEAWQAAGLPIVNSVVLAQLC